MPEHSRLARGSGQAMHRVVRRSEERPRACIGRPLAGQWSTACFEYEGLAPPTPAWAKGTIRGLTYALLRVAAKARCASCRAPAGLEQVVEAAARLKGNR